MATLGIRSLLPLPLARLLLDPLDAAMLLIQAQPSGDIGTKLRLLRRCDALLTGTAWAIMEDMAKLLLFLTAPTNIAGPVSILLALPLSFVRHRCVLSRVVLRLDRLHDLPLEAKPSSRGQQQDLTSMSGCLNATLAEGGVQKLYTASGVSLLSFVVYRTAHLSAAGAFTVLHEALILRAPAFLAELLCVHALPSAAAYACTYPLDFVRARLIYDALRVQPQYAGGLDCALAIRRQEGGCLALYRGVGVGIIIAAFGAALKGALRQLTRY